MTISQLKEQVKTILREKTMNESEFNIGKQQYTKKGLTPTDIHSLTMDYVNLPVTRLQKKQDLLINAFMDMKNLLGVDYNYNTKKFSKSSKPALMVHLLKNTLVDKKEYIDIYKKLTDKITQLSKYVQNSANRGNVGRSSGMAHTYAMRDMQNEISIPQLAKKDAEHLNHYVGGKSEKEVRTFIDRVYKFYPKDVRKYMADAFMDYNKGNRTLKYLTTVLRVMHQDIRESVNEASSEPEVISQLRKIVKDKQNALVVDTKSKKKVRVDMQSANLMLQVYDALKQQSNKDKFVKGGIVQMGHVSYKLLNR